MSTREVHTCDACGKQIDKGYGDAARYPWLRVSGAAGGGGLDFCNATCLLQHFSPAPTTGGTYRTPGAS